MVRLDVGSEFVLIGLVVKADAVSLLDWRSRHVAVRVFGREVVVMSMVG